MTRRDFLRLTAIAATNLFLAGLGGWGNRRPAAPGWIDVVQVALQLPRLPASFSGFRLVQISDLHMGGWMNGERLQQVVQQVLDLAPDLVVITGDFVTGHRWNDGLQTSLDELAAQGSALTEKHTTLAVLGNHDYWTDAQAVRAALRASGILELGNDVFSLSRQGDQLHIAGVDDIWENHDRLEVVLDRLPRSGAAVLLAHEPDFADTSAATGRFDLQLSGHSHGGQVVLPWVGPPVLPPLGRKYPLGLYRVKDMLQYTNRGVGMARLPVRIHCPPEITVFTLENVTASPVGTKQDRDLCKI